MRAFHTCCAMALLCGLVTAAEPVTVGTPGPVDPLWEAIAFDSEPSGGVAGDPCESTQIGNYGVTFAGPNRFRGNVIRTGTTGNELQRFGMELNIPAGLTQLSFWIYKKNIVSGHYVLVTTQQIEAVSAGQSYYWSPEMSEMLAPNSDYAIGVSWEGVTVTYGRDNLANPRPFSHGTIVGTVGESLPLSDELTLVPGSTGAYAMRFCFAPMPGACCVPGTQSCQPNIFQEECEIDLNGYFQGQSTTCQTNPCNFGVCCSLTGACLEPITLDACTEVPGNWSDVDSCNDIAPCPVLAGACCLGTSCIDSMTLADCTAMPNGMFRGNGTECDSIQPECGKGACCSALVTDGCAETTAANCAPDVGSFQGLHTRCIDSAGSCPGRCCVGSMPPTCLANRTPDQCSDFNGVFIGFDNSAMCVGDCAGAGASGKCCLPDGGCALTNLLGCNNLQGVFTSGGNCTAPSACPGTGACCNGSICIELTQAGCLDPIWGGSFLGVGSECTPGICIESDPGGCCIGTSCTPTQLTRIECLALNGEFLGENTTCGPLSCQPFGACCQPNGTCTLLAQSVCVSGGGTFQGDGASCAGVNCPQPQYACCRTGMPCTLATAAMCTSMGGTSQTGVTTCAAAACPAACCLPAGTCLSNQTPAMCTAANGQHLGDGSVCGPNSCPTGACCTGENCLFRTQAGCIGLGGIYEGNGTTCLPNNPCETPDISIVSSVPANGSIDARQPSTLASACTELQGTNLVILTFDGPAAGVVAGDFVITTEPAGTPPTIANVVPSGSDLTIVLTNPIPPQRWTRIAHTASGSSTRIGFLPGDVNNDRSASPVDILKIIDHLNGVETYAIHQTDIDRSGVTNPADVLRVIDLLNGADCYDPYNGATLPP